MLSREIPLLIPFLATGYLMLMYGLIGVLERRKV